MLKRVLMSFLCLILFINYLPLNYAHAEVDNQIPVVESVNVTPLEAKVGDIITIKAKISDSSGVEAAKVEFKTPSNFSRGIWLYFNSISGLWEGTYQVKSTDEPGTWTSSYMYLSDNAGNYGSINPSLKLTVHNTGAVDNQIPVVESVNVTPLEAKVGDIITVKAKINDSSGVEASKVEFKTPSNFSRGIWLYFNSTSGLWEGSYQVKSTDEPGAWTSSYMYLSDNAGNYGSINPSLKLTVHNTGAVDNQIPVVESVNVTPLEAKAGDIITVKAKISDSSGVEASKVEFKTPSKFSRGIWLYFNKISGLWEGTYQVKSTDEPGTWTSSYMYLSDNAGNYGSINPSLKLNVFLDTISPEMPNVNEVTDQSSVVTGTAEAGSTVTVKAGTTILGTSLANSVGAFSVSIALQKAGTQLSVTATDFLGNTSQAKEVTVQDKTAPLAPTVNAITETDTVVTGTTEANATVYVKVGLTTIGKGKADTTGKYSVAVPVQKAGTVVRVIVRDSGGNNSPYTRVTVQDKTAPLAPKVNTITDKNTLVTGTAEANVTVYVKVGSSTIGKGKTDTSGKFSIAVPVQKAGTIVRVLVRDSGGNNSPYTSVTVLDKTAPLAPKVNGITEKDTVVTGTAEANVTVYVKVGSTTIGKGKADTTGKFSVAVPVQKAGTQVRVIVRDSGGNNSPYTVILVSN
jgi:hypothetical protein